MGEAAGITKKKIKALKFVSNVCAMYNFQVNELNIKEVKRGTKRKYTFVLKQFKIYFYLFSENTVHCILIIFTLSLTPFIIPSWFNFLSFYLF